MNRRTLISIGFALPLVIGIAALALAIAQPAHTAGLLAYPDLRMARIPDVTIDNTGSQLQLRFSATIVNVGSGPDGALRLTIHRRVRIRVSQRVYDTDGGSTLLPVGGREPRLGRGRPQPLARPRPRKLRARPSRQRLEGRDGEKGGFCFFDTTAFRLSLPGAPANGGLRARNRMRRKRPVRPRT